MPFQHNLVVGTSNLAIENGKWKIAYLGPCFMNGFSQGSRELDGSLVTLVVVVFYYAHSLHSIRVSSGKMVGYRELWSSRAATGVRFCQVAIAGWQD